MIPDGTESDVTLTDLSSCEDMEIYIELLDAFEDTGFK